jgi:cytochrome b561
MFLALVLVAITVALAYRGYSFYKLSLEDRVEHPDFRTLRPIGFLGNGYGWVAALLVVLNLSYLIRRRFGGAKLGSMRAWLDVHVFTGLVAAVLVSFHSAFQLRSPIATISAVSLGVVVATGLIGRFLYALAPASSRERLQAALDGIDRALPDKRNELATVIGEHPGPNVPANASLYRSVRAIPGWRRAGRDRREAIALLLPPRKQQSRELRRAARELTKAAIVDARASGTAALIRSWRGLHRLFALAMLAAVLFHAGVAWYYGYRWIFS